MFGRRFEKELNLIQNAMENELGKKEFIKYITPFVENTVKKFISDNKLPTKIYEEILPAGWAYLDKAIKNYKERAVEMMERKQDLYYFNTYFAWYIRQGIIDYLKSKNK